MPLYALMEVVWMMEEPGARWGSAAWAVDVQEGDESVSVA